MEDMREAIELLREIRDLQKAHFERYKEFTEAALARQQVRDEEGARARKEQRRLNEEIAQEVKETQATVRRSLGGPWGFVARMAIVVVLAVAGVITLLRGFNLLDR